MAAVRPGIVASRKIGPVLHRRMIILPELDEGIGIGIFQIGLAEGIKRGNGGLFGRGFGRNLGLVSAMALLWIGSFYLYGMGAARMGRWGGIIGWPLFISLSILAGNLWGIWRGEWAGARPKARSQLNLGMAVVLVAVVVFGLGSALR